MNFVEQYVQELRDRAADRRAEGSASAALYDRVADELDAKWKLHQLEPLATDVAMAESGYCAHALRKLKREGAWSGLREDLPKRPRPAQRASGVRSLTDERLRRAGGSR